MRLIHHLTMDGDHSVTVTFLAIPKPVPDEIAVYRPSPGYWYVDRNGNGKWDGCTTDVCGGPFGVVGDVPVVGDWTELGIETVGVYRPKTGYWYLDRNGDGRWEGCQTDICSEWFGAPGDLPVFADWQGTGAASIGVFRPSNGHWYLDTNGNHRWDGCAIDSCRGPFGLKGDQPVTGDWDGTGVKRIGVFRPSTGSWYLDMNGNGLWDGCAVDHCPGPFGLKGDVALTGKW